MIKGAMVVLFAALSIKYGCSWLLHPQNMINQIEESYEELHMTYFSKRGGPSKTVIRVGGAMCILMGILVLVGWVLSLIAPEYFVSAP